MNGKAERLRKLRADLEYHEMMLRVDMNAVRAGARKCRELKAEIATLAPPTRDDRPKRDDWTGQAEPLELFA